MKLADMDGRYGYPSQRDLEYEIGRIFNAADVVDSYYGFEPGEYPGDYVVTGYSTDGEVKSVFEVVVTVNKKGVTDFRGTELRNSSTECA